MCVVCVSVCLQVVPTWRTGGGPGYVFSYRVAYGRDAQLDPVYLNKISVHLYNGTRAAVSFAYPVLQGMVDVVSVPCT